MTSIWSKTQTLPPRSSLCGFLRADAAVIGGGMAGILSAYLLKQRGLNVVVLEAARMAGGQTQNTTAKLTVQHGAIYHKLLKSFGSQSASLYYQAQTDALSVYEELITGRSLSCDYVRLPSYLYTTRSSEILNREAAAAEKIGIPFELTKDTTLPFPASALRFPDQARFHPLKFLNAIAGELRICENTRVTSLQEDGSETILTVPDGTVHAKYVIFACHYPFINVPGFFFMKIHQERSYVIALEHAAELDGLYYGIDPDGHSFRNQGSLLLLGGEGHRTGEHTAPEKGTISGKETDCISSYQKLERAASEYYPGSRIVCRWSAQDCMTPDNLPYIGRFSKASPNWYLATGFRKWGMTNSMVSARLITDLITGEKNPYQDLFSPSRFTPAASAGAMLKDGMKSVRSLTKELFSVPREKLDEIPNGSAGIISWHGEKTGIYKNADGHVFAVSVRCPHLGCQLCWNQDELSWDCPCHGSRFDYTGKLIDNPAETDIAVRSHSA